MPAPLDEILLGPNHERREIDNHYHLQLIAADTAQVFKYQQEAFRFQRKAALKNLHAMESLGSRQDRTNALIEELNGTAQDLLLATNAQTELMQEGFAEFSDGMRQLNTTAEEVLAAIYRQTEVLQQGFETVARLLMEQQRALVEVTRLLRNPYETKAQELLREAERALIHGMRATGRDRQEEFRDAFRLLSKVLNNPIGSRDFIAWFQFGWLKWKVKQSLPEAEEAFYQATRLSVADEGNPYHAKSIRHLAYVQYLQGKHQEAYATIQRAVRVAARDHDILYDAARYAAKTKRTQEVLALLEQCIDLRPQTIVTMFSEPDFVQ